MLTPLLSQLFRWLPGMSKFQGSSPLVSFVQEVINNEEEEEGEEVAVVVTEEEEEEVVVVVVVNEEEEEDVERTRKR